MKASQVFILLFVGTALGCVIWLGFFHDWHDYSRQLSQEDRHAELVGAKPLPIAPIEIKIASSRSECVAIDRAELNDNALWVYLRNQCQGHRSYIKLEFKGYAPDGTIVAGLERYSETEGGPSTLETGEKAEIHTSDFKADPRMVKVSVSVHSENY